MGTSFSTADSIDHFKFEPGDFVVLEFSGHEEISQLTHFDIRLLSKDQQIDLSSMLNKRASLKIWSWQDQDYTRAYHGLISSFEYLGQHQIGQSGKYAVYRAKLVPSLWALSLNYQSRIFQEKSVPAVVEAVLKEAGFGGDDYRMPLRGSYDPLTTPPREFCVQYCESDFDFISRLMEEMGIFYFFEYKNGKDVMVIADSASAHGQTAPMNEIPYEAPSGLQSLQAEYIFPLYHRDNMLPSRFMLKDFNFNTPQANLLVSSQLTQGGLYVYDYPGRFGILDRGRSMAGVRNEESVAQRRIVLGTSNCRSLCAGYRFKLLGHPREEFNVEYLLTRVSHHGIQGGVWATDAKTSYENHFECIPASVPYRPPRVTYKPFIKGTQTAIVVGPQGEEIYVDEKGRVKVQFHWDIRGAYNENSSCWVRVSQKWAGDGWGSMFIPRIGQEVVVSFIEGDPDQPLIIGEVYNGTHQVPYTLPRDKTRSTVKSNSSKGGEGFNEIRFEDKKGEEQVFIHAQKNQDNRVENDSMEWIGQDRHLIVKRDQIELAEGDEHLHVKGDHNEKVDGTISLQAGVDMQEKVGSKYALDSGTEIHLKAGTNVVIESGTTLTVKVGSNFININSMGIFVKGNMVMLNSGGAAGSGAGSSPDSPKDPKEADRAEPGRIGGALPEKSTVQCSAALALRQAAQNGTPFCPT